MGVAYYPVFEKDVKGFDPATAVSGKALAKAWEFLDEQAAKLGVRPLSDFYSESTEEAFETIGEDIPPDVEQKPAEWFAAKDALATITALTELLQTNPSALDHSSTQSRRERKSAKEMLADFESSFADMESGKAASPSSKRSAGRLLSADAVLSDLQQLADALEVARKNQTRFRLRIDI